MLNAEKYKEEIKKIINISFASFIALVNNSPVDCLDIDCEKCDFFRDDRSTSCRQKALDWLIQEYKEDLKLTSRQYSLCLSLQTGYLVRNRNGNLMWFNFMPVWLEDKKDYIKDEKDRISPMFINDHMGYFPNFDFIKKGDKPYSIVEMLNWEIEK